MLISNYSILMSFLCFNVFIVIIIALRNNNGFVRIFGVGFLFVLIAFCIFRALFAVEFPFTNVVKVNETVSQIFKPLNIKNGNFVKWFNVSSVLILAMIVSMLIGICIFIWYIINYCKLIKYVHMLDSNVTETDLKVYRELSDELKIKKAPKIIKNKCFTSPAVTGFFKPVIFVPDRNFSEKEMYYILKHELMHYINKDIWVKLLCNMLRCLFWWDILVYFLEKEVSHMLELKCDMKVCEGFNSDERREYLNTILKIIKSIPRGSKFNYFTSSMTNMRYRMVIQRFNLVANKPINKKAVSTLAVIVLIALTFASYLFVIQPFYKPPEYVDEIFVINPENSKIVYENEEYKLYTYGRLGNAISESELEDFRSQGFQIPDKK